MSDAFEVRLQRLDGYRFQAEFGAGGVAPLIVDEPPPLGAGSGPDPASLLAVAVGNCLSASLLFCLAKARLPVAGLRTTVRGQHQRNERGRLRIGGLEATLELDTPGVEASQLRRCLELFEDYCVVTASVRAAVPVRVRVLDRAGRELFGSGAAA